MLSDDERPLASKLGPNGQVPHPNRNGNGHQSDVSMSDGEDIPLVRTFIVDSP